MYYTQRQLNEKLRVVGDLMPDGEYNRICAALTSLVGKPRELRVFVEGFNCEVAAHVTHCARIEAAVRESERDRWRQNDRRKGAACD